MLQETGSTASVAEAKILAPSDAIQAPSGYRVVYAFSAPAKLGQELPT